MSEHAVILHFALAGDADVAKFHAMSDRIAEAIDLAGVGEFDGDEFGEGECVLYMYGPDAERLFDAVRNGVASDPLSNGDYAFKRYGAAGDPNARETRVDF